MTGDGKFLIKRIWDSEAANLKNMLKKLATYFAGNWKSTLIVPVLALVEV